MTDGQERCRVHDAFEPSPTASHSYSAYLGSRPDRSYRSVPRLRAHHQLGIEQQNTELPVDLLELLNVRRNVGRGQRHLNLPVTLKPAFCTALTAVFASWIEIGSESDANPIDFTCAAFSAAGNGHIRQP